MDVRRWKKTGGRAKLDQVLLLKSPPKSKNPAYPFPCFPKMGYPLFGRHIHLPWSSRHASMAIPSSTHRRYKAWPKVEAVKGCAKIFVVEAAHFLIHDAMNPYKRNQRCGNFILKFCDSEPKLLWFFIERIAWKPSSSALFFFSRYHNLKPTPLILWDSWMTTWLLEGRPLAAKFFGSQNHAGQFLPKWILHITHYLPHLLVGNIPKNDPVWQVFKV